jgi:hypothetical protein
LVSFAKVLPPIHSLGGGLYFDNMDPHLRRIFMFEVAHQCDFAERASQQLEGAVRTGDSDGIWFAIHALLSAAANVSKILWPPNTAFAQRGEELRRALEVGPDSMIQHRDARNHLEHFDERIETWYEASRDRNFVDTNIGPLGMIPGIEVGDMMRSFDPSTGILHFRGDSWDIGAIGREIRTLAPKAWASTH